MPYGTIQIPSSATTAVWSSDSIPSSGIISVRRLASFVPYFRYRAGTNSAAGLLRQKQKKTDSAAYELVRRPVKYVKSVRIWDARRGKFRTVKIPVESIRLVKKRIKRQLPKLNLSNLPPNTLIFRESKLEEAKSSDIYITSLGSNYYPPKWWKIVGDTYYLGNSFPFGWGTGSPSVFHPDNYGAGSLEIDFKSILGELQLRAVNSIYGKAKNQSVNLANFLAEISKTKSSFVDIVKRLARVIISAKSGNFLKAARELFPTGSKAVANDTLLWQYGIRPLLSDIDGMCKHLAEFVNNGREIVVKSRQTRSIKTTQEGQASSSILYRKEYLTIETEVTVVAVLKFKVDNPALQNLSQLGFTNPATVAWELTPWSFVIDWLIPIGKWLDTLDTWAMLTPVSYHETSFIKQHVYCTSIHSGTTGTGSNLCRTVGGASFWHKENTYCNRAIKPLPSPPPPRIKSPISTEHAINALALLRQKFK